MNTLRTAELAILKCYQPVNENVITAATFSLLKPALALTAQAQACRKLGFPVL